MTKLKLASVEDEKPVKLNVVLPAALHRDLVAYAQILSGQSGKPVEPAKLIAPMLEKFIAGDREFAKARGAQAKPDPQPAAAKLDASPPTSSE
ncbi:MAG: DUF2274 domain-containing protein [Methylocystis sp.]